MDGQLETIVQDKVGDTVTTGTEDTITEPIVSGDKTQTVEDWKKKHDELKTSLSKRLDSIEKANSAFQREKDIAVKEAKEEKQKRIALEKSLRNRFKDDEVISTALDSELEKSELEHYRSREAEESKKKQAVKERQEWAKTTAEMIKALGVDPNHPDLAKAPVGATSYAEATRMIIAKANEIKSGGKPALKDEIAQMRAELRAELRKEMGLDSENLIPPVGNSSSKRYTRGDVRNYSPVGKSVQQIGKDVDAVLDQYTRVARKK